MATRAAVTRPSEAGSCSIVGPAVNVSQLGGVNLRVRAESVGLRVRVSLNARFLCGEREQLGHGSPAVAVVAPGTGPTDGGEPRRRRASSSIPSSPDDPRADGLPGHQPRKPVRTRSATCGAFYPIARRHELQRERPTRRNPRSASLNITASMIGRPRIGAITTRAFAPVALAWAAEPTASALARSSASA
jgi:hypothetical protein